MNIIPPDNIEYSRYKNQVRKQQIGKKVVTKKLSANIIFQIFQQTNKINP